MAGLPFAVRPLALGAISCGNQVPNRLATMLAEIESIGMVWQSSGASNLWVRGDLGSAQPIDFVSLIWANAGPATTIRVRLGDSQAQVDGASAPYDSGALPFISPAITREDGAYSSHLEIDAVQTRRWWRIDIGSHTGDFRATSLVLGRKVQPSTFYNPGWGYGVEDLGDIDIGRWGIADETPGLIARTLSFKLGWLSETDFEQKFRPLLERLGKRRVALWCFDPDAGPYRQARTYLGWIKSPAAASGGVAVNRYEQEFEILSMI